MLMMVSHVQIVLKSRGDFGEVQTNTTGGGEKNETADVRTSEQKKK